MFQCPEDVHAKKSNRTYLQTLFLGVTESFTVALKELCHGRIKCILLCQFCQTLEEINFMDLKNKTIASLETNTSPWHYSQRGQTNAINFEIC